MITVLILKRLSGKHWEEEKFVVMSFLRAVHSMVFYNAESLNEYTDIRTLQDRTVGYFRWAVSNKKKVAENEIRRKLFKRLQRGMFEGFAHQGFRVDKKTHKTFIDTILRIDEFIFSNSRSLEEYASIDFQLEKLIEFQNKRRRFSKLHVLADVALLSY